MESFAKLLSGLFEGLNIRRRWFAVMGIVITVIITILALELTTGYIYYWNLEKKTNLLKTLHALAKEDIASNSDLYPIYLSTAEELASREIKPLAIPTTIFPSAEIFWRFLSGAALGILLILFIVTGLVKNEDKNNLIFVSLLMIVVFGYIGVIIPIIYHPLVNYIGFPIIQYIVIMVLGGILQRRRS